MRLTKIVCTLGPSSATEERIIALAQRGMDIARINLTHGTDEDHRATLRMIRSINEQQGLSIASVTDNRGSDIRTGDVQEPVVIAAEQEVLFCAHEQTVETDAMPVIRVNYNLLGKDARDAECIILDNGTLVFDLVEVRDEGSVVARARNGGRIGSRRHVNLPGAFVSLPALTDADWQDLDMAVEEQADYVALSFIRTAEEVEEVRERIRTLHGSLRIITKIETRHAVQNIDAIIAASDAIMVARGDLGVEIPFERVPAVQDSIVAKCRQAGKPVIVATHMLESMISNPMPTRAEVTDIAHAVTTRADATMLSGETAAGAFPMEAVQAMARVLTETEEDLPRLSEQAPHSCPYGDRQALAEASVRMALALRTPAILVLTLTGATAQSISRLRPGIPIIALTQAADVQRALQLVHGVIPLTIPFDDDPEETLRHALDAVQETGLIDTNAAIVTVTDARTFSGTARTVQIRRPATPS
jgi:pyruvate kinase